MITRLHFTSLLSAETIILWFSSVNIFHLHFIFLHLCVCAFCIVKKKQWNIVKNLSSYSSFCKWMDEIWKCPLLLRFRYCCHQISTRSIQFMTNSRTSVYKHEMSRRPTNFVNWEELQITDSQLIWAIHYNWVCLLPTIHEMLYNFYLDLIKTIAYIDDIADITYIAWELLYKTTILAN